MKEMNVNKKQCRQSNFIGTSVTFPKEPSPRPDVARDKVPLSFFPTGSLLLIARCLYSELHLNRLSP